jgi:hypothetical protein
MNQVRFPSLTRAAVAAVAALTLAITVGVVLLPQAENAAAGASTPPPLGLYAGGGNSSGVAALGQSIGQQPAFAMDFLQGSSWQSIDDISWWLSQWDNKGYSMIWGVPILPNDTSYSLAAGATGAYNQYFVTLAQEFVAGGQGSSIIRLGWEFNGSWFPWAANGQAANFIAYWQQIVNSMRSVPGANFKFEWNPTLGDQGVGNLANYYPGNNYVDYIGADVYDTSWATYPGAQAEFNTMETETYGLNWLASFAAQQGKPITLPEWGLGWGDGNAGQPVSDPGNQVSGGDDPTFINDMANWIATNNVYEATFWDYGTSTVTGGTNPNSEAALIHDFGPAGTDSTGSDRTAPGSGDSTPPAPSPATAIASLPSGGGYWMTNAEGIVTAHGSAVSYGSLAGKLNAPISHIVSTPDGKGYWLVASDGGVFSFGDAHFFGSMGGKRLNAPVVDIAPTSDGKGYWLVASDGGVFSFGDAAFHGSTGNIRLNAPIVGIAPSPSGSGYWLVASDGGIFSFGHAPFLGSMGGTHLNQPVVGMASTASGLGYYMVSSDGGVFSFGDAAFHGSTGGIHLNAPIVGMATDAATGGYWLAAADGGLFSEGAPFEGAN